MTPAECVELLTWVFIWSLVTYRVARHIVLDTLWDNTRTKLIDKLQPPETREPKIRQPYRLVKWKLGELIGCPFCVTVWVAAGVVFAHRLFVDDVPIPVWAWLATAAGGLVVWAIVDNIKQVQLVDEDGRDRK